MFQKLTIAAILAVATLGQSAFALEPTPIQARKAPVLQPQQFQLQFRRDNQGNLIIPESQLVEYFQQSTAVKRAAETALLDAAADKYAQGQAAAKEAEASRVRKELQDRAIAAMKKRHK